MSPSGKISEAMVEAGARALLMAKFGPEAGMLFEPVPGGFEKSAEAQAMFTKRTDEARQEARACLTATLSVPTPGTGGAVKVLRDEAAYYGSCHGWLDSVAFKDVAHVCSIMADRIASSSPVGEMDAAGIPFDLVEKVENRIAYRIALGSTPRAIAEDVLQIVAGCGR